MLKRDPTRLNGIPHSGISCTQTHIFKNKHTILTFIISFKCFSLHGKSTDLNVKNMDNDNQNDDDDDDDNDDVAAIYIQMYKLHTVILHALPINITTTALIFNMSTISVYYHYYHYYDYYYYHYYDYYYYHYYDY